MRKIDLSKRRYGKLTVLQEAPNDKPYGSKWLCLCDCGNEITAFSNNLRRGNTQSCGCLATELKTRHGLWGSKVYKAWDNMRSRCRNPNATGYENWGGRGIKIFEEWVDDFDKFFEYVSLLPNFGNDGYTLDRINNDGNYEPGNLRWATLSEQNKNKRY